MDYDSVCDSHSNARRFELVEESQARSVIQEGEKEVKGTVDTWMGKSGREEG